MIDNSVTAGARKIELFAETHTESPSIGILDDGTGMDRSELLEAMRPGSRNPLEDRSATYLGRFGLGLKTASFSPMPPADGPDVQEGRRVHRDLGS